MKPPAPLRALLFDLDGTLIDTAPELAVALNRTLASYGRAPVSGEQVRAWIGDGARALLGKALAGPVPDPIASSIAGALAAAAALHCASQGARRLYAPEVNEAGTLVPLERRDDCPGCASPWRTPRVIRTRNRWTGRDFLANETPSLAAQVLRLSDAVVTACDCASCGAIAALTALVNRPAAQAAALPACPSCGAASVRIEARETFSLGELSERFGRGPVPAKFALAEIGGAAVCFDLEGAARDPGSAA